MTREDAIARIAAVTPLSPAEVDGFLSCTPDEQAALIETYRLAGTMPSASAWDVVLDVLKGCAEVAELVLPITGAISGVFGLTRLGT